MAVPDLDGDIGRVIGYTLAVYLSVTSCGLPWCSREVCGAVGPERGARTVLLRPARHVYIVVCWCAALRQLLIDRERRSDHVPTNLAVGIVPIALGGIDTVIGVFAA